ncbi:MAG: metallophosphatase [Bacteroidetes bacterium 43-93]|nr:metallophosphoesterase [Bacteroidota bacterium]OJX00097.1 MAG: metallophosphatase [Bacteroidetes bacterium 43-93]
MALRLLIFLGIFALIEYYSFIVVRSAVRTFPSTARTIALTIYACVTIAAWSGIFLFRFINWPSIPHLVRNFYIAFTLGFIVGKLLVTLVMLGDEVRRLFVWIFSLFAKKNEIVSSTTIETGKGISRSVFMQRVALLIGGTVLGAFVYGITNRYNYRVHRIKLSFKNLPPAFKGLRIVQISDIHSGSFDSHHAVERGARIVMEEKPDLILFTGDLVNNKAEEVQPYTDIFSRLKAPLGVYSTLGNHDYGDYEHWPSAEAKARNLEWLKQTHGEMGWRLLMNEHIILDRGEDKIALIGIENWGAKAGFPKYGRMDLAYSGLPEKNIPFKILMSHDPSHWDAQVRPEYSDIDLTLSGHTHGMQLGVEIPGFKWSPVQYIYKEWAGLYQQGSQMLYVNRGFGFLGYPGRLGILPEITVIELA